MAVGPRIDLRQSQKLALTPSMRTALGLLRMPTDQLNDEIANAAAENPFLEVSYSSSGNAYEAALEIKPAHQGMSVSLAEQIDLQRLAPEVREAALFVISQLREDGYLDVSLEELSLEAGLPLAELEQGLMALQRCEPTGIGARDLAECLELQLVEKGYDSHFAKLVLTRLEDIAEDRLGSVMRHLGLDQEKVGQIARDIRGLTPTPVVASMEPTVPRVPELRVDRCANGTLEVTLNPEALPTITLLDLGAAACDSPQMKLCFNHARHLTRGLAARSTTLLRIGRHIVAQQDAFFLSTPPTIRPESQAEAAAKLGIHPSTMGRALAGKSLVANGKIYALSLFFSRALPTADGSVSAFDIQARLRRMITAEDRHLPLADEAICAQLRNEGVDIARRTVAKYRKCIRIPSSFKRRRRNLSEPAGAHSKQK